MVPGRRGQWGAGVRECEQYGLGRLLPPEAVSHPRIPASPHPLSLIANRSCCSRVQSARSTGSSLFRTSCSPLFTIPPNCLVWYVPESTTRDELPDPVISARNTASASPCLNGSVTGCEPDVSVARIT